MAQKINGGVVLAQAPILNACFYITYSNDPILYMYQLLDDYKEGDLLILPEYNEIPRPDIDLKFKDGLIGKIVEYTQDDGSQRAGKVIGKVEAKQLVYFIKFDDDFHIYVYNLVNVSNWQSYITTVEIKLSFLDFQRMSILSVLGAHHGHKFVLTNTHFCGYGMLSVSPLPCGKHWVC